MSRLEQLQDAMKNMKKAQIPRLKPGQGVKGNEPYGCFNTGFAWVLHRSVCTDEYLVARQIDMDHFRNKILFHAYDGMRAFALNHDRGWRFKTRASAVKKFHDMNFKMMFDNLSQAIEHEKLRIKAQKGDIGAALACMDY